MPNRLFFGTFVGSDYISPFGPGLILLMVPGTFKENLLHKDKISGNNAA